MKKHIIAVILAVVTCLAALSGCSLVKGLEHELQVVFEVDGKYYDSGIVTTFENIVVEEPGAPKGYYFKGWTAKPEWTAEEDVPVLENTGLVRYNDVKDLVKGGSECVTLYGVFAEIVRHDLKIAWYNKEGTSGLNDGHITEFKTKLYAYLTSEGYTPDSMDIVIKGYEGDVGTSCGAIMKDGDVDIMLGWAATSNLTKTGGMDEADILENNGSVKVGSKARYAARLSDTDLCKLAYTWIRVEYGGYVPPVVEPEDPKDPENPEEPTEPEEPTADTKIVIGWWTNSKSGLNQTTIDKVMDGIKTYLTGKGYDYDSLDVTVRGYDKSAVADVASDVTADDDVDIMFGMKAFAAETSEQIDNVTMGTVTDRRIHLLKRCTSEIAKEIFEWFKTEESARALFAPAA